MNKKAKEGSFGIIILIMFLSFLIAIFWEKLEFITNLVNAILSPTAGALLDWNINIGMLIIVFILTFITTLVQKYATDQQAIKKLKDEQKEVQKEMKKHKDSPEKFMELQKKSLESMPQMMKLSMRGIIFTGIPFVIFFRWFMDYFQAAGDPKIFGIFSWIIFYILFSLIFSSILRKILKVI